MEENNTVKNKSGWKLAFIVLFVVVILGIVAAFAVPSFISKKDNDSKDTKKKPENLTKDSEIVKELFDTYKITKYNDRIIELAYTKDPDFINDISDAKEDFYSDDLRLVYAIYSSLEDDEIACSELKYQADQNNSCFKATKECGAFSSAEECAFDKTTKTKYAKLDKVKAKYKELYNQELEASTIDNLFFYYNEIGYDIYKEVFFVMNHVDYDEGMWTYSKICDEKISNVVQNGDYLEIVVTQSTKDLMTESDTCKDDDHYDFIYRFKYDGSKYVLMYNYFVLK